MTQQQYQLIKKLKQLYNQTQYGFLDRRTGKNFKQRSVQNWHKHYRLNSPQQTQKYKVGNCYDTTHNTIDKFIKARIKHRAYHTRTDDPNDPTHSFVLYEQQPQKWKWLQGSWGPYMNNDLKAKSSAQLLALVSAILKKQSNGKLVYIRPLSKKIKSGMTIDQYFEANPLWAFHRRVNI